MTEPHFFTPAKALRLREIVALTGATLRAPQDGGDPGEREITGIASLDQAGPRDLAFIDNAHYVDQASATRAGACLTSARFEKHVSPQIAALRVAAPYRAFVEIARQLYPDALRPAASFGAAGVAAGAALHPDAKLEHGVTIEPGAVIGAHAEIGAGTVIGAATVIGAGVRIGRNCTIGPGATLQHAILGDRVIIHPGVHVGQDGFGYVMGPGGHLKVPQTGRVIIQNDVEIGAGSAIDRGANRDTVIGEGTKIDNLVQVGHNVSIGRHCVIVGQSGISGSVTLEDFVVLGGRVGVNNHVTIGEGAQIGATSSVNGDVPAGEKWGGTPAKPYKQWFREVLAIEKLARGAEGAAAGKGGVNE